MILTTFRCLGLLSMGAARGRVSRQLWKSYLIGYDLSANKIISGKRKVDNTCYLIEQITNVKFPFPQNLWTIIMFELPGTRAA